ncbi:MAG: hypothetical protein II339_03600 [Spirochaetales bacterium]|nr:hypothetical protein [Spirochaetales bacterium]
MEEPKTENNGEQTGQTEAPETAPRQDDNSTSGGNDNGGNEEVDTTGSTGEQTQSESGSESDKESGLAHDYPARKGNATRKKLVDTFGFSNVDIPDSRKPILNAFYDFMMEMAKTLGISPKSIGNGGWLTLGNLRANAKSFARHAVFYTPIGGNIVEQHLFLKYSRVSSIAHEWWHSLDHALGFFESGKHKGPVTEISYGAFDGRKEVLDAVRAVMQAIKDSGYTQRIQSHPYYSHSFKSYVLEPTESAARAFAEYIKNKFDEQGIVIAGVNDYFDDTQPTAEEMELITPAIENLFNVLQEKEGKRPCTSILYQIGEDVDRKVASSSET